MKTQRLLNVLILILSLGLAIGCTTSYVMQSLRISFASEQIDFFWCMSRRAEKKLAQSPPNVRGAAGLIVAIDQYYPSGTKQRKGSRLDKIVERARTMAKARIASMLNASVDVKVSKSAEEWTRYRDQFNNGHEGEMRH